MEERAYIDGDRLYDLFTGVYKPQLIHIALALDVFSPLQAGPADVGTVALACGCDPVGVGRLLDYLTSLKVLEKRADYYELSALASTFLVRGKKAYAGDLIMDFTGPTPWESVQESISYGRPRVIHQEIHFAQDAWIESYRPVRIASSLEMWATAGINPQESTSLHILDIACGCAIKSLVLAQRWPNVQVTCLDTPQVLEAAHDLAERLGVLPQVHFNAGNLLTVELGEAQYDACLLGQITHYLSEAQNRELFQRICRAVRPGGSLVLDVPMDAGQVNESTSFLSLILWANSGGRAYSFEEYRDWLEAAGFTKVKPLSERRAVAVR